MKGASARERVRCALYAPDGAILADVQSTAIDVNATAVIHAQGDSDGMGRMAIRKADGGILEDFTVELIPPLEPLLFLYSFPDH